MVPAIHKPIGTGACEDKKVSKDLPSLEELSQIGETEEIITYI